VVYNSFCLHLLDTTFPLTPVCYGDSPSALNTSITYNYFTLLNQASLTLSKCLPGTITKISHKKDLSLMKQVAKELSIIYLISSSLCPFFPFPYPFRNSSLFSFLTSFPFMFKLYTSVGTVSNTQLPHIPT
jgi:hypothetical protein